MHACARCGTFIEAAGLCEACAARAGDEVSSEAAGKQRQTRALVSAAFSTAAIAATLVLGPDGRMALVCALGAGLGAVELQNLASAARREQLGRRLPVIAVSAFFGTVMGSMALLAYAGGFFRWLSRQY